VVETVPALAFSTSADGSNQWVNRRWVEYSGLSPEATSGSGWRCVVHPDDLETHMKKWQSSLASGEPFENEARYRSGSGEYRWFLVRGVPLRDKHGRILKWYGTLTDIEDRKHAEEERQRSHRLLSELAHINRVSTMGELAAAIAHELKQPIAASITRGYTVIRWLKGDQPNVEQASIATTRIIEDGKRASDIIDRLQSLYKKSSPQRERVDVNDIIRQMVVLLRSEATGFAVSLRTELGADLPKTTADRVQLQQVLMNLMLNGIEAMKEIGGRLTVKSQLGEQGQLLISISDNGIGLPDDKVDQIFDSFFTTKLQGSGMGLAISRSIIEAHDGRLWATANEGRGASFHFTLPSEAVTPSQRETGLPMTFHDHKPK
jgi:PAS domain S-box-containing protein